jgi:hypothetical protein
MAVSQAQQGVQQVQQTADISAQGQQQQATGQEQQTQLQQADISQGRKFNQLQNKLDTTRLLQDFEQNKGKLNLQQDRAATERLVQGLRLQNTKYLDTLHREGDRKGLDNDTKFTEEMQNTLVGDAESLQRIGIDNTAILGDSDREFAARIGQMSIDQANQAYREEQRAATARAPWEALGSMAGAAEIFADKKPGNKKSTGIVDTPTRSQTTTAGTMT